MAGQRLLATDLDGTFLGNDEAMLRLESALPEHGITLVFCTGRHLASIQELYASKTLTVRARACVCMVGTDLYWWRDGSYQRDADWHGRIRHRWNLPEIDRLLGTRPELRRQEAEWQSPFKRSYYVEAEHDDSYPADIQNLLKQNGLHAKVVYSADTFLDLIPVRAGKGEAIAHVARRLGIANENVITCGDSGNDLDMMKPEWGFRAIVVGNASPELRAFQASHVYHAQADCAAGIVEGLQVYGWL